MAEVLLSFIVPVFNVEPYIEPCIQSILKTSSTDEIEIIAVDDGSRDASGALLDRLAAEDARLKVIHQQNQGVSVARNAGIESAAGRWLTFVDGDDLISERFVTRLRGFLNDDRQELILSSISLFYQPDGSDIQADRSAGRDFVCEGDDLRVLTRETLCPSFHLQSSRFLVHDTRGITATCFRADIVRRENLRFVPGVVLSQDFLFRFAYMSYIARAVCVSDTTYYYRKFSASSTSVYRENMLDIIKRLCTEYVRIIDEQYHGDEELKKRYYAVIIMQSRRLITTCLNAPQCPLKDEAKLAAFEGFRRDPLIALGIERCARSLLLPPYDRLLDAWRIPDAAAAYRACIKALSALGGKTGARARVRAFVKRIGLYDVARRLYHKAFR